MESDWSDEELQELEKILGDIQERSDAADAETAGVDPLERRARAVERWNKVGLIAFGSAHLLNFGRINKNRG